MLVAGFAIRNRSRAAQPENQNFVKTILRVTGFKVYQPSHTARPSAVVHAGRVVIVTITKRVTVEASTPFAVEEDLSIEWGGDLGQNPDITGGVLETTFAPGAHTVTAKGVAGGSSLTVKAFQSELEVINGHGFTITAEPQMPVITARLHIIGPVTGTVNQWKCRIHFAGADDCNVPHFGVINDDLEVTQGGGQQFSPSFDKVRGRSVDIQVSFTIEGETFRTGTGTSIWGTNPQRAEVQAALPHDTLKRIACKESGQRQFDAPADGGQSLCPLYSNDRAGRVGIMQVPNPTPDDIWNWQKNIESGKKFFKKKVADARKYPSDVRESAGFQSLVDQFNQKRQQAGLSSLQEVVLRNFKTGNFDNHLEQLELDAIRGYNGWHGPDRFGFELHEFRVAVDRVDGEDVPRVININEQTLTGEAVWEQVPVADRPQNLGEPDYVSQVLGFLPTCLDIPLPAAPTITATNSVVVVTKPYTSPARRRVELGVSAGFIGTGTFTISKPSRIRFFDAVTAGNPVASGAVFTAAQLQAGVVIFAEGVKASDKVNDVVLTLGCRPGQRRRC